MLDVLVIYHERPEADLVQKEIGQHFVLKQESMANPTQYLVRGRLHDVTLENGVSTWTFGCSQFVKLAVSNVNDHLWLKEEKLVAKVSTPLLIGYQPVIDMYPKLGLADASNLSLIVDLN